MSAASGNYTGSLTLICGPMFAGKTTRLLALYQEALAEAGADGAPCLLVQYADTARERDGRSSPGVRDVHTHDAELGARCGATHACRDLLGDASIVAALRTPGAAVFIDEVHFFTATARDDEHLVAVVTALSQAAFCYNVRVVCAGLCTDWRRRPFRGMRNLEGVCTATERPAARCAAEGCLAAATCTERLDGAVRDTLCVGGANLYRAVCKRHHPLGEPPL